MHPRNDAAERIREPPEISFIIFVDRIFTTLVQRLFTNAFDVLTQSAAISCVYRACNAD
jgi:hypothetical protein